MSSNQDNQAKLAGSITLGVRLFLILIATVPGFFSALYSKLFLSSGRKNLKLSGRFTHSYLRSLARIAGIRISVTGSIPKKKCLIVPNHIGYCDILALGAAYPTQFLTPQMMDSWPVAGFLIRNTGHPFVSRKKDRGLLETAELMRNNLEAEGVLTAFLEGTSTGGDRVLPLIPSLFQPAIQTGALIVPCGMKWSYDGTDISEDVAYWKDHEIGSHALKFLRLKSLAVEICLGEPIPVDGKKRRVLAQETRDAICKLSGLEPGDMPQEYIDAGHILLS